MERSGKEMINTLPLSPIYDSQQNIYAFLSLMSPQVSSVVRKSQVKIT